MILPLDSPLAQLDNTGGKGANLSKLIQAGFPVPPGFVITTAAYLEFVAENSLSGTIYELTANIDPQDNKRLENISRQIRAAFEVGNLSPEIREQIQIVYENIENRSVALRSSATAEDLPGLSFAGQQDTFLNINGEADLLEAVVGCWSSLWTARAISYRLRNQIPSDDVALAVVVQEMVPCSSSGVLFTANPLTGSRSEMVINATFGLGEMLVSGQVEPDHYLVDTQHKQVIERKVGSKSVAMYAKEDGGFSTLDIAADDKQVLSDDKIFELAELGMQVHDLFGFAQDIEWGIASDQIYLLQSRPITTLFPMPEQDPNSHLKVYFSFAAIQGILEPITPLGQDAIRWLFAGGASLFELDFSNETQPLILVAGERLWVNISNALQNPLGSRIIRRFMSVADPGVVNILGDLVNDPNSGINQGQLRLSTLHRFLRFAGPFLKQVYGFVRSPGGKAVQIHENSQAELSRVKKKYAHRPGVPRDLQETLNLFLEIRTGFTYAVPHIATAAAGGIIPFFLLNKLTQHLTGSNQLALEITRGLPNNVTTEMDLDLWGIAKRIRSDKLTHEHFRTIAVKQLTEEYSAGELPIIAQAAIEEFLGKYGMRGLGEIDIGRVRWREDPTYIIEIILNYLQIDDPALAPDVIFQNGERVAEAAVKEIQAIARSTFGGRFKAALIGYLAVRERALAGLRESPKFHIIQLMGIIRQGLLESGQQLVADGKLDQTDDLFYLYLAELDQVVRHDDRDWRTLITQRRASYQYELKRKQLPRLLLSDGRAFYEGLTSDDYQSGKLIGSPVSPGVIEGIVRVVMDPLNPDLKPGEIIVCPGTDPAWTPLFLTAGGLIMEVGGMMTHGAIVAREYGIPAVVGVDQATIVLQTGQRIQLNGTTGEILLLDS